MSIYIAFLRGIMPMNPNMGNAKLRGLFEELGFKNVQTVISSGNVIFESKKDPRTLEKMIEDALPKKLGFQSKTIVWSRDEVADLVKKNPFKKLEHSRKTYLNVTFIKSRPLRQSADGGAKKLKVPAGKGQPAGGQGYKIVAAYKGAVCSVMDVTKAGSPDLMLWLEKEYGKEITTRTWKTVNRILVKMEKK